MKKLLCFIIAAITFFILSSDNAIAQSQEKIDSLFNIWNNKTAPDTSRAAALYQIINTKYLLSNTDSALYYIQIIYDFAKAKELKKWMAYALDLKGEVYLNRSEFKKISELFNQSLNLFESIHDSEGVAYVYIDIGNIYLSQFNYITALKYYTLALNINEKNKYKRVAGITLGNIGNLYYWQGENEKALDYWQRANKIYVEFSDKNNECVTTNNIGIIYSDAGNFEKALYYFENAKTIAEQADNKNIVAGSLMFIADVFYRKREYSKSKDYALQSIKVSEISSYKMPMSYSTTILGLIDWKKGNFESAIIHCKKGLQIADESEDLDNQKQACQCLYDTYKSMGNTASALTYYERVVSINDSLHNIETSRKLQQLEYAKQQLTDSLAQVEKDKKVEGLHREEVKQKNKIRNIIIGIGLLVLLLATGLYSRLQFTRKSKARLEVEKSKSDNLLLNILPAEIAEELKAKGKVDARDFDLVSVLFTDFKEFTQASEKLTAQQLVEEINSCFAAFDNICSKYGIEKIKTIGDAYMAAGGLPVSSEHAVENTVSTALEMQQFISERKIQNKSEGKPSFDMRIGIHTGPVVAGIVGLKKFAYDIWGDTVNTASRMESNGEAGQVNISGPTYTLVKDKFNCIHRGKIDAKGKGEIDMYFVEGRI